MGSTDYLNLVPKHIITSLSEYPCLIILWIRRYMRIVLNKKYKLIQVYLGEKLRGVTAIEIVKKVHRCRPQF